MRWKTLLPLMGVVMMIFVTLALLWRHNQVGLVRIDQGITIGSDGVVRQAETAVALAHSLDTVDELRIPLVTPATAAKPVTGLVTVRFEMPQAKSQAKFALTSILTSAPASVQWKTGNELSVQITNASPESYLVLYLRTPKGVMHPGFLDRMTDELTYWPLSTWLVLGLLMVLAAVLYSWKTVQAPLWISARERVTPPGDLRPLELALLHHGEIRAADLAALLFSLAGQGYLQIIDKGEDNAVFLRTAQAVPLVNYEQNFLLLLFPDDTKPRSVDEVAQSLHLGLFGAVVHQCYVDIYGNFRTRGFFRDTPYTLHARYRMTGFVLQVLGLLTAFFAYTQLSSAVPGAIWLGVGLFAAGLFVYPIGAKVVQLTRIGLELVEECAAYQNYLRNPLSLDPLKVSSDQFYQYVPAAIVLQCTQPWLNRFAQHTRWAIPDWYTDLGAHVVGPGQFVRHVQEIGLQLGRLFTVAGDQDEF